MDRLAIRQRPRGYPIMRQHWGKLLFMHWPFPYKALRALVPDSLEIDLYHGAAWVGLIPFTMWGVRPSIAPGVPGLTAFHELNVRTYVHRDGVPGVYFFSLDASLPLAVWAGRRFYHLPYYTAEISLTEDSEGITYRSRRVHKGAPAAKFSARWRPGNPLSPAEPGTLSFFLTERYCLYTVNRDRLYRCRIHHPPWPLRNVELESFNSDLFSYQGIPEPTDPPVLHYAKELPVDVWPLTPVEALARARKAFKELAPKVRPEPGTV